MIKHILMSESGTVLRTIPARCSHDPASRNRREGRMTTTAHNPTGGGMFLINLFGKKGCAIEL